MPAVIKAGQLNPQFEPGLRTVDLHDHIVQADGIITEATNRAKAMIETATQDAKVIREEARKQGYEEGYQKGNNDGLVSGHDQGLKEATFQFGAEQKRLCTSLQALVDDLESRKRDLLIDAAQDMLLLATTIAEKVTKRAVQADPDCAVANLEDCISLIGEQTDITARIHPDDGEAVRRFASNLKEHLDQQTHFKIIEDELITRGGCIVQTDKTEIDATIETQINQIVTLLIGKPLSEQTNTQEDNRV